MILLITAIFITIYFFDIVMLFIFGLHSLVMVYLYRKSHAYCESEPEKYYSLKQTDLPVVTVQLPIFNELFVVDRLIDSTIELKYPKNKLEIQVLDDSTDETVEKVSSIVKKYKNLGFNIRHIHRKDRSGHKAGALENGLKRCQGEFVAIFDADFIPNPDFLLKTLPYFKEKNIIEELEGSFTDLFLLIFLPPILFEAYVKIIRIILNYHM